MGATDPNPAKERFAGGVTLGAIALITLCILMVTQLDWNRYREYRLVFSLRQDASGIQPGTPVNVGGLLYGKVLEVAYGPMLDEEGHMKSDATTTPDPINPATKGLGTIVTFQLDTRISLWPSARISRDATVLGGNVSIQIHDTGSEIQVDPQFSTPRAKLAANATIRASNPPSGMSTIFGSAVSNQLTNSYEAFYLFYDWFTHGAREEIVERFESISSSMDELRAKVNTDMNDWRPRLASLKSNTDHAIRRLGLSTDGNRDPDSYSSTYQSHWPGILENARSARDDYQSVERVWKQESSQKMAKVYDQFQQQFALFHAELETLRAAGSDARGMYDMSIAQLSLCGGQIIRSLQELLPGLVRAVLEKPNQEQLDRLDQRMIAEGLALQAQEVQLTVEDLESLVTRMRSAPPEMVDEIRRRTGATLEQLKKSLDAFNASLHEHYPQ